MITTAEARDRIIDDLGVAIGLIGHGVAALGEAYEQLDVDAADRLEDRLFRPTQRAYGRAKRTYAQFVERYELSGRSISSPAPGPSSQGVKSFVETAVRCSADADRKLAELQDSMLPIEAGDPELRTGLGETREHLQAIPTAARDFIRVLGR